MPTRREEQPSTTPEEAHAELAKIAAEDADLRAQIIDISRRREALNTRRKELHLVLARASAEACVGEFVAMTAHVKLLQRREPKPGDIGRVLKIGRTRALIDFGDQLRTWYVPIEALGEVKDPLADDPPDEKVY